jgi:hypothetical protein
MGQLGHADPKFTLRVYAHQMRRGDAEREALRALVGGEAVTAAAIATSTHHTSGTRASEGSP